MARGSMRASTGSGALQRRRHALQARQGRLVGGARGYTGVRAYGTDDRDEVAHGVEDHHHARAHQDGIRNAERVGVRRAQGLHGPDHVVTEIAEQAGGHGRKRVGLADSPDGALGDQRPQARERRCVLRREIGKSGVARDLCPAFAAAPGKVGVEADHRVAPANGAALDGFEEEGGAGMPGPQLQESGDGGLQIRHQGQVEEGGATGLVGVGEGREVRVVLHRRISTRRRRWPCGRPAG